MLKLIATPSLLLSVPLLLSVLAQGQNKSGPLGLFEGAGDIGKTLKGSTVYDPATGTYTVTGGGADMWGAEDDFQMAG